MDAIVEQHFKDLVTKENEKWAMNDSWKEATLDRKQAFDCFKKVAQETKMDEILKSDTSLNDVFG